MPAPANNNKKPWLIAAWPGMGNVAVIAAAYLVQKLPMTPVGELPPRGHFDVPQVLVKQGVIGTPRLPRSVLYRWNDPEGGRDLLVFIGEAQPTAGLYAFAHEMLDRAAQLNVERVYTFASMASQLHPSKDPKVFGAATTPPLAAELRQQKLIMLDDGQIGGLNGVLLGAAAERGIPGLCLLGEIPFFAAGVPNPKAAKAVLSAFSNLAGIHIDLAELAAHAETVDTALVDLLDRLREQARERGADEELPLPEEPADIEETESANEPELDPTSVARIERMFEVAMQDRSQAVRLKEELDRLGVFDKYENRFLDLFRRGE